MAATGEAGTKREGTMSTTTERITPTVAMNVQIAGRFVGTFHIGTDLAYEYEARSPWDDGRGRTIWTFADPQDREYCRRIWRAAHPQDTI